MAERKIAKWMSESDPHKVRRLGKTLEELGELIAVLARCLIQGSEEIDPGTGRVNHDRLEDEMADVTAQMKLTAVSFQADTLLMDLRIEQKIREMREWEKHF